jgi:hypothetical protein
MRAHRRGEPFDVACRGDVPESFRGESGDRLPCPFLQPLDETVETFSEYLRKCRTHGKASRYVRCAIEQRLSITPSLWHNSGM